MTLPEAKDFTCFFSDETNARKPSPLKSCIHLFNEPDLVFLGGGLPLSDYFPWDNITVDSPKPPFTKGIGQPINKDCTTIFESKFMKDSKVTEGDIPLARALQYGFSAGQPELMEFLKGHTEIIHDMQYSDWNIVATTGNTNSWESTLRVFCNKGDVILAEAHSFSSSLAAAEAQGVITFPVPIDEHGIIPSELEKILDNWTKDAPKPKLLYTIPTGQNPTGSSLSEERKIEVYRIAQKHNFLIIEDEPYYFLQTGKYVADIQERQQSKSDIPMTHDAFLQSLAKTFLSLDVDGRVIRMDSFSKVLAPGTRLGWITGSKQLLQAYISLHEMTIQAPAGITQTLVAGTLSRWGQDGYLDWLIRLREEYTIKRDNAIDALYKYLPNSPAFKINPPIAGMFFTVNVDTSYHPEFQSKFGGDAKKVEQYIYEKVVENGVLVVPGAWFITEGETEPPQPKESKQASNPNVVFFRGTYAAVNKDKLVLGIQRLADTLKKEFAL